MDPITLSLLIIGGLNLAWNIFSGSKQQDINQEGLDLQKKEAYGNATSTLLSLQQQQENIANTITATEGEISTYEQFMERYPAYEQTERESALAQGKQQFQELAENFAISEVMASARGTKGSSSLVSKQKQTDIKTMFGEDMAVDAFGGIFGLQFTESMLDVEAKKTQALGQINILSTSLESLKTSYTGYTPQIQTQQSLVDQLKREAGL